MEQILLTAQKAPKDPEKRRAFLKKLRRAYMAGRLDLDLDDRELAMALLMALASKLEPSHGQNAVSSQMPP